MLEKLPLSALSSLLTVDFQRHLLLATNEVSPAQRAANTVASIARYLGKLVWPHDLALLYPYAYLPTQRGVPLDPFTIAASAALCAGITLAVLRARRQPYLAVGCL